MCRIKATALVLAFILGPLGPALAEELAVAANEETGESPQVCVPHYKILASKLQASYEEVPVSAGIGQDGNLVSVFASPNTGSWTLVMTKPEGTSCVVAVGQSWESKQQELGPPA